MENDVLHHVRRLYVEAQKQYIEASFRKEPPAEYLRGKVDAFYAVLVLIQVDHK